MRRSPPYASFLPTWHDGHEVIFHDLTITSNRKAKASYTTVLSCIRKVVLK
ncbi:hypothetical protein PSPO01_15989 [Paraphaeosphaeria sporulosa]